MKNFFRSLSPWHKALCLSLIFHVVLFGLFFWPDDTVERELQIVDTTKQSDLEMDIAPQNNQEEITDSPVEPEKALPESAVAPSPPLQEPAAVSFDKSPPKLPIREPSNEQRDIQPPQIKKKLNPHYTGRKSQELPAFKMKLVIMVSETGQPTFVAVQTSSGIKELDEATVAAVKQWEFYPAYDRTQNRPVPHPFVYDFTYPIDDKDSPVEPPDGTTTPAPSSPTPTAPAKP